MKRILCTVFGVLAASGALVGCKNWGATLNPYTCESGEILEVKYPSVQTAFLYYKGKRYRLRLEDYSEDERFRDKNYEWHTEGTGPGSTGILTRIQKDGTLAAEPTEICVEDD